MNSTPSRKKKGKGKSKRKGSNNAQGLETPDAVRQEAEGEASSEEPTQNSPSEINVNDKANQGPEKIENRADSQTETSLDGIELKKETTDETTVELQSAKQAVLSLTGELDKQQNESRVIIEELKEELEKQKQRAEIHRQEVVSLTEQKLALATEVNYLKQKVSELTGGVNSLNSEKILLIANVKTLEESLQRSQSEDESEKQVKEGALQKATKENEEKVQQIEILRQKLLNVTADYKMASQTIDQLQLELSTVRIAHGPNTSSTSSTSASTSSKNDEVSHLKGSITALEAEVEALTKKLKNSSNLSTSSSDSKNQEKMQISVAQDFDGDQVTYLVMVSTDISEYPAGFWSVARRYNQFRALYERLEKLSDIGVWFRFPERTYVVSKNDPEIVEERKVAFQKLCHAIAADPVLRIHPTVKQFLDPKVKFDLPIWS